MAQVSFHHPLIARDLFIDTKPDQITWAYGLNTAVYPTYGGEVVQILSVYFDDMNISGTVRTYKEAEEIYGWFIAYMQYATQGRDFPSFDQHPVTFHYPERQWTFQIWPKAIPGFRYGRDVVAPEWSLVAAVKEPDATFANQLQQVSTFNAANGNLTTFGKTTANFGATGDLENNPWASPDGNPLSKGQTLNQFLSGQVKTLADSFSSFVGSYQNSNLNKLPQFPDISKANVLTNSSDGTKNKKAPKVKSVKSQPRSSG